MLLVPVLWTIVILTNIIGSGCVWVKFAVSRPGPGAFCCISERRSKIHEGSFSIPDIVITNCTFEVFHDIDVHVYIYFFPLGVSSSTFLI